MGTDFEIFTVILKHSKSQFCKLLEICLYDILLTEVLVSDPL